MSRNMQERCLFFFHNNQSFNISSASSKPILPCYRKEQMEKEFAKPVISESERWFKNAMLVCWEKLSNNPVFFLSRI